MSENKQKKRTLKSLTGRTSTLSNIRTLTENLKEIHHWEGHIIEKIVKQASNAKKAINQD